MKKNLLTMASLAICFISQGQITFTDESALLTSGNVSSSHPCAPCLCHGTDSTNDARGQQLPQVDRASRVAGPAGRADDAGSQRMYLVDVAARVVGPAGIPNNAGTQRVL